MDSCSAGEGVGDGGLCSKRGFCPSALVGTTDRPSGPPVLSLFPGVCPLTQGSGRPLASLGRAFHQPLEDCRRGQPSCCLLSPKPPPPPPSSPPPPPLLPSPSPPPLPLPSSPLLPPSPPSSPLLFRSFKAPVPPPGAPPTCPLGACAPISHPGASSLHSLMPSLCRVPCRLRAHLPIPVCKHLPGPVVGPQWALLAG